MLDISVVVPIYNTEKWLENCLDSIIAQKYSFSQIILIDDGSTDESAAICDRYAHRCENVLVKHISNSGAGAARNIGIDMCTSEWVMFVDSDDFISQDFSEVIAKELDASIDMIMFNAEVLKKDGNQPGGIDTSFYTRYCPGELFQTGVEYFAQNDDYSHYIAQPCLAIYRRKLLDNAAFLEGVIFEDEFFSLVAILNSGSVKVIGNYLYFRRIRENSVMTSRYEIKMFYDWCLVSEKIIEYLSLSRDKYTDYTDAVFYHLARNCNLMLYYANKYCQFAGGLSDDAILALEHNIQCAIKCMVELNSKTCGLELKQCVVLIGIALETEAITKRKFEYGFSELLRNQLVAGYAELLHNINLSDSGKCYAFYGVGQHTEGMIRLYETIYGEILAQLLFCVTCPKENMTFHGKEVLSIYELPKKLDGIIISSYRYHDEMLSELLKVYSKDSIIDVYEQNDIDLFAWVPMFMEKVGQL